MPPILLQSLKSLNFSWIVQTLCAKDGNKNIFTSSSLGERFSPFQEVFLPVFRVAVIIL